MIETITIIGTNGYQVQLNTENPLEYPITGFDITYDSRSGDANKSQDHGTWPEPDFLGNAHVSIECDVMGSNPAEYWQRRMALMAPFTPSPQLGFDATVQVLFDFMGVSEVVSAYCNLDGGMPDLPMTTDTPFMSKAQINLKMRDPRFYAQFAQQVTLEAPQSGVGFTFPIGFPLTLTASGSSTSSAFNAGYAYTPPTVVVVGPCNDPTISVVRPGGTVDVWGLRGVLIPAGHSMTADFGRRTVELDGQYSLYKYKAPDAKWWQLWNGSNTVMFTALNADPVACSCTVQWQNAYFF